MRRSFLLFDSSNRPTEAFANFMRDVEIPGDALTAIDEALQRRFFQKGPDQQPLERWELKEVEISCPSVRFQRHLQLCGFGKETIPTKWEYDRAAWPGALLVRAISRLNDLCNAWASGVRWTETIVFGGKRPIQAEREAPDDAIFPLCGFAPRGMGSFKDFGVETELDMMRWLWKQASMPAELQETAVFVDAPMKPASTSGGDPIRPSTEDTIREWLKSDPLPGTLLLSSGAPYGMAQDEALWMLLEPQGHTVETFGHGVPDLSMEVFMREVAGAVNRIRRARGL